MASFLGSKVLAGNKTLASCLLQHKRGFKSALKIKWVRPEKVPFSDPKMSGDLATLGTMDMSKFPTTWSASKELQSANEDIKRIHSLEFFHRQVLKNEFMEEYANRVKSHQFDDDSPEVRLAKLTARIRNLKIHMDQFKNDKRSKIILKESIDKRSKLLNQLKHRDYKKYEWLLDKLDLEHKAFKIENMAERVERKKSLRRLTMLYVEKIKAERLQEYKDLLESQKEDFFIEKIEKFIWMKKTEEECGVPATVTEADIETVREQLKKIQVVKPKEIVE